MLEPTIQNGVEILKRGGLVAFPTETVYGLGADANNPIAINKIFQVKNRPKNHPLIVHIGSREQISDWAVNVPDIAWQLAAVFWPGPLTMILQKAPHVCPEVTGGQATIGLRFPQHPVALELLQAFGGGLAAPSANRFQKISPTTKHAVVEELGDTVDLVLEGGQCQVGVESTIVDLSSEIPVILRPGMITSTEISHILNVSLGIKNAHSPKVSGSHDLHYAPKTNTFLLGRDELEHSILTQTGTHLNRFPSTRAWVLLLRNPLPFSYPNISQVLMPNSAKEYAKILYQTLRDVDKQGFEQIIIEALPDDVDWEAVRDRVGRAANKGDMRSPLYYKSTAFKQFRS